MAARLVTLALGVGGLAKAGVSVASKGAVAVSNALRALNIGDKVVETFAKFRIGGATSRLSFVTTDSIAISGRRPIDLGQSYEVGVRGLYGDVPFSQRQYEALVDGKWVDGVADNAIQMGGKNTAIEAKYVDDWSKSLRNPESPNGAEFWAVTEQKKMLHQAKKYEAAFDQVIYHTNSYELASHYSAVFSNAGLKNFKFVITPVTK